MKKKIIIIGIILISLFTCLGVNIYLDTKDSKKNNEPYVIITDYQYTTLQNDGGTHYNVYYEIEGTNVRKLEDYYVGFEGYKYQGKVIYEKTIVKELKEKSVELIESLLEKKDSNDNNNYEHFIIKNVDEEKSIYNEDSINLLKELVNEFDNL